MFLLCNILLIYLLASMFIEFSKRYKKLSFFINWIFFSVITGSVYEAINGGGDYDNYRYFFKGIENAKKTDYDIGFYYLNLIIKQFTDNFHIAFIIFMLIINFFILITIYKFSENIELSLLMYVILGGYITASNITRQYLAASLYFFSIQFLLKKKYILYVYISLIAYSFHSTVLIPIILTVLIYKYSSLLKRYYLIYFFIINSLVIIEPIIRKIGVDFVDNGYSSNTFNYGSSILHYLVQLIFITFYYFNRDRIEDEVDIFFINMAMLCLGFTLLSSKMVLYARIASYFNTFNLLGTVNIIYKCKNIKEKRIFAYFCLVGLIGYYFLLTSKGLFTSNYIIDYFKN